MNVSVVIPALNEEDRIEKTVKAARSLPDVVDVWVVDDGSRDRTSERAEAAGARVIRLEKNRGKAKAAAAGAESSSGDVVLFLDADLAESASEARALLLPVLAGEADLTVAIFPKTHHKGGFGWVVGLAQWGIRRTTGHTVEAPLSGQRAVTREVLQHIRGLGDRWEMEVGMTIDALRAGYRLKEVPTSMGHRLTGRKAGDFLHRAGQLWGVAGALWKRRF